MPINGVKASGTVTADGIRLTPMTIEGVSLRDSRPIPTGNGVTVECLSSALLASPVPVHHAVHVRLIGKAVAAWHKHLHQTDLIFPLEGELRIVLVDDRDDSPSFGRVMDLRLSALRPGLLVVPPGIWHGVVNLRWESSSFLNMFDRPYQHDNPDDWLLPASTDLLSVRLT